MNYSNDPHSPTRQRRLSWTALAILLFLIAAASYWVLSGREDNERAPAPTPIYEDVHEIAP
ncbi:MAG: hypothetical protein H6591_09750 [Flavobacteriales bacterium]|nr:hypothetical protein [Flavobacteriales bacterium]